jgi:MFS family permease
MFKKPSWRKRSLLVMFLLFASQSTGVTGISNYLIPILTNLGFEGGFPLIIYAIYSTVGTTFVLIVTYTVDRVGRRRMFLICYPALAVILLIEGLLQRQYLGTSNRAGNIACVVMMNVYVSSLSFESCWPQF